MNTRVKIFSNHQERDAFFARSEVKDFIGEIRSSINGEKRSVSGATLTIPEVMLEVLRDNMTMFSKLLKHVSLKSVKGKARQNVMGDIPEGVWIEATGSLNELDLALNQVEVDGYLVGGFIPIANSYLEDSDMNLGTEIMMVLGKAIGKGLDRAILFGTGVKMPLGIVTRLAQTAKPSDYNENARTWVDLHTSNILKINASASTGAAFFVSLIQSLGIAKPEYSDGAPVWIMNRKTHNDIRAKALAFNIPALVAAGENTLPVVGGVVEELEMLGDYEIVGGFGANYLMVEREGQKFEPSEHVRFLENQTVFKGFARYDGEPVVAEGFVMVSYDNTDAATSSTFQTDYANTALGVLGVTAAAGTASGDTVLTVTGTESSGTTLKFKIGDLQPKSGETPVGYTALTSGTTQITIAAGKTITVVELDGNGRVIKTGKVIGVPKA